MAQPIAKAARLPRDRRPKPTNVRVSLLTAAVYRNKLFTAVPLAMYAANSE